jgi:hypothetical protein
MEKGQQFLPIAPLSTPTPRPDKPGKKTATMADSPRPDHRKEAARSGAMRCTRPFTGGRHDSGSGDTPARCRWRPGNRRLPPGCHLVAAWLPPLEGLDRRPPHGLGPAEERGVCGRARPGASLVSGEKFGLPPRCALGRVRRCASAAFPARKRSARLTAGAQVRGRGGRNFKVPGGNVEQPPQARLGAQVRGRPDCVVGRNAVPGTSRRSTGRARAGQALDRTAVELRQALALVHPHARAQGRHGPTGGLYAAPIRLLQVLPGRGVCGGRRALACRPCYPAAPGRVGGDAAPADQRFRAHDAERHPDPARLTGDRDETLCPRPRLPCVPRRRP